jgi:hypothetical protein
LFKFIFGQTHIESVATGGQRRHISWAVAIIFTQDFTLIQAKLRLFDPSHSRRIRDTARKRGA